MLLRKLFTRKNPRSTAVPRLANPGDAKPGNMEAALNPFALLVKGAMHS